jgi:hypothetical protein
VRRGVLAFCLGCGLAIIVAYGVTRYRDAANAVAVAELQNRVERTEATFLASTRYRDYLAAGKRELQGQAKLVTASVSRPYTIARGVETRVLGVPSKGAIVVTYTVDFAYGYDFASEAYEIVDTPAGIEIRIDPPKLVAKPAVGKLHYEVLASGWWSDEKLAALKVYEEAAALAQREGVRMQDDPEIRTLCESRLIAFLRDFLGRQPGVSKVPAIIVTYRGREEPARQRPRY